MKAVCYNGLLGNAISIHLYLSGAFDFAVRFDFSPSFINHLVGLSLLPEYSYGQIVTIPTRLLIKSKYR